MYFGWFLCLVTFTPKVPLSFNLQFLLIIDKNWNLILLEKDEGRPSYVHSIPGVDFFWNLHHILCPHQHKSNWPSLRLLRPQKYKMGLTELSKRFTLERSVLGGILRFGPPSYGGSIEIFLAVAEVEKMSLPRPIGPQLIYVHIYPICTFIVELNRVPYQNSIN